MIWCGIKVEQLDDLEATFAVLTEDGWKIPDWLVELTQSILERDKLIQQEK